MQIKITNKRSWLDRFLLKISNILFGIFLASLLFVIPMQLLGKNGIYLGFVLSLGVGIAGTIYTKPKSNLRLISYSLIATVIAILVIYFVMMSYLQSALEL
ncbi:hypothetical protein KJ632_02800 [Patescibacteria group bacterium]|nr:hypothetical protein [Patescibacteria group bacterium]